MNELKLIAFIIEFEGSIQLRDKNNILIRIGSSNHNLLTKWKEFIKCGNVSKNGTSGNKPYFCWSLCGIEARDLYKKIEPFLITKHITPIT